MALSSMTGFARASGVAGAYMWAWELKSVNAKGLELRLRLPPGWDAVEAPVRARGAEVLARGAVYANLTVTREGIAPVVRINEPVLAAVLATIRDVSHQVDAAPRRARRWRGLPPRLPASPKCAATRARRWAVCYARASMRLRG